MTDSYELASRQSVGKEAWDAFVGSADEAWLWHLFDFQDALATWPGRRDISFAVLDKSHGNIIAIVPLQFLKGNLKFGFSVSCLDSLGGIACHNDLSNKEKRRLIDHIREQVLAAAGNHGACKINIALSPMAPAWRGQKCPRVNPLLELGCNNTMSQTWVIDLSAGKDSLWKRMKGRARTAVRKAEKSGVAIRKADRPGDNDIYYNLHVETYARTGAQPHPRTYFDAIWSHFLQHGFSCILFAELDGKVVAAENFGVFKKAAIYWTGSSNSAGISVEANSLLQWTAIQWMVDCGTEWYETGEAFPNATQGKIKGLSDFKKSFGGELYPFYKGEIEVNNIAYKTYKLLRNAKGLLAGS